MKIISIMNLKGGVAKTTTAVNVSHILSLTGKKVLLLDNDKQGNSSKAFNRRSYDHFSIADVLLKLCPVTDAIRKTDYKNLDILPANLKLVQAMTTIQSNITMQAFTIYPELLKSLNYDYCIIDNPPDVNIAVINALHASDEIIVPIVIDEMSFDGFDHLQAQIRDASKYNPKLKFTGCLITRYDKKENVYLEDIDLEPYKVFPIRIRRSNKVAGMTFKHKPILEFSPRSSTAKDYVAFVNYYFKI